MSVIEWAEQNYVLITFTIIVLVAILYDRLKPWLKKHKERKVSATVPRPLVMSDWNQTPSDTLYDSQGFEEPEAALQRQYKEAISQMERVRKETEQVRLQEEKDSLECKRKREWYVNKKKILGLQYTTWSAQAQMANKMIEQEKTARQG